MKRTEKRELPYPEMTDFIGTETFAEMAKTLDDHKHSTDDLTTGTLPIERGGTGGATASDARNSLDVYGKSEVYTKTETNDNLKKESFICDLESGNKYGEKINIGSEAENMIFESRIISLKLDNMSLGSLTLYRIRNEESFAKFQSTEWFLDESGIVLWLFELGIFRGDNAVFIGHKNYVREPMASQGEVFNYVGTTGINSIYKII